jgi:Cdc6-like AAA superfamily ATPase
VKTDTPLISSVLNSKTVHYGTICRDTGSARQAIDLLREGGNVAEEQGDEAITDSHIEIAAERFQRGRVQDKLHDQTMHAQLILEALAHLEIRGQVPVRSKEIQNVYVEITNEWNHDPLTTLKSIQNHLSDLTMLGFLERTEQNEGRAGGAHYQYELILDPEIIIDTRNSIEAEE